MKIYAAAAALALLTTFAHAQTIAYDAAVQPGNQAWTGNLGLDFTVNAPIVVTHLGAFNANAPGGFVGEIEVGIFVNGVRVGPAATLTGTGGTLIHGNRFDTVQPAFILPAGNYSIVDVGHSASDLNGNITCVGNPAPTCFGGNPFTLSTENADGTLVSFTGSGRYDTNTTLDFPTNILGPGTPPSNSFLAGTFQYTGVAAPTLSMGFGASAIPAGGTTSLTFQLTNPNPTGATLTGLNFSGVLPSGLMISTPNGLTGSCGGGTITATAGSSSIGLSGANLAGGTSCTFSVNVTAALYFSAIGQKTIVIPTIGSNQAPNGGPATATLLVNGNPFLSASWFFWY
jgi:hypothetical protein